MYNDVYEVPLTSVLYSLKDSNGANSTYERTKFHGISYFPENVTNHNIALPTGCIQWTGREQRSVMSYQYSTPPCTQHNIRCTSVSPVSRMLHLYDSRHNNVVVMNQPKTRHIVRPAISIRSDRAVPPIVYRKATNSSRIDTGSSISTSSPHLIVAPATLSCNSTKKSHCKDFIPDYNSTYYDEYTLKKASYKCQMNSEMTDQVTWKNIYREYNKRTEHSKKDSELMGPTTSTTSTTSFGSITAKGNSSISADNVQSRNTRGSSTQLLVASAISSLFSSSMLIPSENGYIEVKKDLVKRATDASNGVLQNLTPSEYIRLEDLILEPATQRGTFGVVFRGRIKTGKWINRDVAVKRWKFDNESRMTEENFKSLEREVYAYRNLRHPNICSYVGVCLEPGFYAIITEYLTNGNLFDLLYENKVVVSASDRLKIARQLCSAISYIHRKGMVHRDIKTANIILDHKNNMKLCDFGQTRSMQCSGNTNTIGITLDENGGSPRYMAPECFYTGKIINEKSDIWGAACCLLEIFGGPIPYFEFNTNDDVINAVVVKKQRPKVPNWFHPTVTDLLNQCFERKANNRPGAYELLNILNNLTSDDIIKYGMNVKRDIDGEVVASGGNSNVVGNNRKVSNIISGKCIGNTSQQRRIVIQKQDNSLNSANSRDFPK
ncbi:protein kinase domain-containing protein [Cryptosporidium andersoni]|uniref:Protein kinase domain-containing protein n=1 Tax=Cryptosporidium andersoni TaxID=117008 RepID=A0A1J4MTB4_9CRYT|nr:protein kinase domain-containing protein [Cryptosporidium andersoni]